MYKKGETKSPRSNPKQITIIQLRKTSRFPLQTSPLAKGLLCSPLLFILWWIKYLCHQLSVFDWMQYFTPASNQKVFYILPCARSVNVLTTSLR